MIIIDSTYFEGGKLAIPQAVSNTSITGNAPTIVVELNSYIDKYEEQLLKNAIGHANYDALNTAIGANPELDAPGNEIWDALVNGKVYTYESTQVEWKGLRQTFGTIKTSLIANYVYYHFLKDDSETYTTTGIVTNKASNADRQDPNVKLVEVWRDFIKQYQYGHETCPRLLTNSWGAYGVDWYGSQMNADRSLYQFLRDNDDYGTYTFHVYDQRNTLGL